MAQTTTVIFNLATLLVLATVVLGQSPPSPEAPSPTVNEDMICARGLTVCLPAITQEATPSQECCTALATAVKTQLSCLCGSLKNPMLLDLFNVTGFNLRLFQTCELTTDPNLCSKTAAQAPLPHTTVPPPGPAKANKNAASKHAETGFLGIVLITVAAVFY